MITKKLVVGCDGDLVDATKGFVTVRPQFQFIFGRINKAREVASTLRNGAYAWPGGYPLYFITRDGAALCFECVRRNWREVVSAMADKWNSDWRVIGCDVNYEDAGLVCAHCGKAIESAYGTSDPRDLASVPA